MTPQSSWGVSQGVTGYLFCNPWVYDNLLNHIYLRGGPSSTPSYLLPFSLPLPGLSGDGNPRVDDRELYPSRPMVEEPR